jgi:hypothetical protein
MGCCHALLAERYGVRIEASAFCKMLSEMDDAGLPRIVMPGTLMGRRREEAVVGLPVKSHNKSMDNHKYYQDYHWC